MVNGSKVFISAGHVSTWHMLICYEDVRKPADSLIMLAVKTGMKGFTFGHKEHKMGQKACVASELIFEDCFVPDENVCFSKNLRRRYGDDCRQRYGARRYCWVRRPGHRPIRWYGVQHGPQQWRISHLLQGANTFGTVSSGGTVVSSGDLLVNSGTFISGATLIGSAVPAGAVE